jgi:hypothetical protein
MAIGDMENRSPRSAGTCSPLYRQGKIDMDDMVVAGLDPEIMGYCHRPTGKADLFGKIAAPNWKPKFQNATERISS